LLWIFGARGINTDVCLIGVKSREIYWQVLLPLACACELHLVDTRRAVAGRVRQSLLYRNELREEKVAIRGLVWRGSLAPPSFRSLYSFPSLRTEDLPEFIYTSTDIRAPALRAG
jgi:hypothetical protein